MPDFCTGEQQESNGYSADMFFVTGGKKRQ
jgi:hypothetical protein